MCPLWIKLNKGCSIYHLYNLIITNTSNGLNADVNRSVIYSDKKIRYLHSLSFAVKHCKRKKCEITSVEPNSKRKYSFKIKKNIKDFFVKCDYMHLKSNSDKNITATLEIKAEGVCPIEINNDSGKTDTVYVRSIKTSDGYKALISTRDSYIKEVKMNKNREKLY